ncbi:MAG TPA: LytTR family DNA-binding domain-containing protein [Pseudorhizobium sp.]|jgi:hypothetical protein|nr:LytTR family DNA-binding domain-containing protein [Pseudorhizobium sp.]
MRHVSELGLFILIGTVLSVLGPFGTIADPVLPRTLFWLSTITAGGMVGILLDIVLQRWFREPWLRMPIVSVGMTPAVTLIVLQAMNLLLAHDHAVMSPFTRHLLWQVFIVCLVVMGLRMLVQRKPEPVVETPTVIAPPVAEAKLRSRLSARRRTARLIALEADDHYVRVHTDAGVELLALRFSDAVEDLCAAHGYRVHRSWWVAADAIRAARWRRGSGELELEDGSLVPISRSGAPLLRAAGWL